MMRCGQTDTLPLRLEMLFLDYSTPQSFALASVLTFLSLITLLVKVDIEHQSKPKKGLVSAAE